MKVGRNDPCPCNSGKKYKKCCIDKEQHDLQGANQGFTHYAYLKTVDTLSLVKTFAGLTLLPQNHGKYFRLKNLSVLAFLHQHDGGPSTSSGEVTSFVNSFFAEEELEDKAMCAFTDLVTFDDGDFMIFPGLMDNSASILANLLAGLYHWEPSSLPVQLKGNVYHITKLILAISNSLAERLKYSRYMEGNGEDDLIFVPDEESLARLRDAVTFSQNEMTVILKKYGIAPEVLPGLLVDESQINATWLAPHPAVFSSTPIYFDGRDYIIVHPPILARTLIDRIWEEAAIYNCTAELARVFHDLTWNYTKQHLVNLGFMPIEDGQLIDDNQFRHALFSIDLDKHAYVNYIGDERNNLPVSADAFQQRWQEIYTKLSASPEHGNSQVLVINIIASNGRPFHAPLLKAAGACTLNMPVVELNVLADLLTVKALNLWKYAFLTDKLETPEALFFSFLDGYKFYSQLGETLPPGERHTPLLLPGYSSDWVLAALHKADRHSVARRVNDTIQVVPVRKHDGHAPIYFNEMELYADKLLFAVEIGDTPIWVGPDQMANLANADLRNVYWQFTDAIAYWLWQLENEVNSWVTEMGLYGKTVHFRLDDPVKFLTMPQDFTRHGDLDEAFIVTQTADGFLITIPHQMLPYLYGADNEGERVLLKNILAGFNLMLKEQHKPAISSQQIEEIINRTAPIGHKKKVFLLDSRNNILLDPSNLKEFRYVKEHDVSHYNNLITVSRFPEFTFKGLVTDKTEKTSVISAVVHNFLLPLLKEKLTKYNSESLLKRLIGLNESLIRAKEEIYLTTPTRIACFVSIEQHQKDVAERINENSRTNVAVRCLIEHIAAERYEGTNIISNTAVDELIAVMDRIVHWGGARDQIYFDLMDINLMVYDNGIIGIVDEDANRALMSYLNRKTKENVTDSITAFQHAFPVEQEQNCEPIPAALDNAFLRDVGITFTRICEFLDRMTVLGLQQSFDYGSCPLATLRVNINELTTEYPVYTEQEFQAAMNFLSLKDRGGILNLPGKGYDLSDISPWRYNRILSFLRRPLIIAGSLSQELVYWGPRQCMQCKATIAIQLLNDRFKTLPTQKNIKAALGVFGNERGKKLETLIVKGLQQGKPDNVKLYTEQFIKPGGVLKNAADIGDIDVLVIDPNIKTLYSIESKAISPSRSIKEMVEEVGKLMDEEEGWVKRHMLRHDWLKGNLQQVSAIYGINVSDYQVKSIFVTAENMLTPHLEKVGLPLPFLTRYDIEETGYPILQLCK